MFSIYRVRRLEVLPSFFLYDIKSKCFGCKNFESSQTFGTLAQLVEQQPFKLRVTGSSPVRPTREIRGLVSAVFVFIETRRCTSLYKKDIVNLTERYFGIRIFAYDMQNDVKWFSS